MPVALFPKVSFDARFAARLERFALSVRALSQRREGAGRAGLFGGGGEFAFHRAYRRGDDPRRLDWDLYARLDQPYVRVLRRESAERWLVWIDTSASMAVGPPGKIQLAAEIAAALAAVATAVKGEARIVSSSGREVRVRSRRELPRALAFLETLSAEGSDAPRALSADDRALAGSARVFVVGDLFGLEPRDVLACARGQRRVATFQVLAPHELAPPTDARVRWMDPESGRALEVEIDSAAAARYVSRLSGVQETWRGASVRHRALFRAVSSDTDFESLLTEALVS